MYTVLRVCGLLQGNVKFCFVYLLIVFHALWQPAKIYLFFFPAFGSPTNKFVNVNAAMCQCLCVYAYLLCALMCTLFNSWIGMSLNYRHFVIVVNACEIITIIKLNCVCVYCMQIMVGYVSNIPRTHEWNISYTGIFIRIVFHIYWIECY